MSDRVVGELLRLSHPAHTQYHPFSTFWADGNGKQLLDPTVFAKAGSALGREGVSALAQLLGRRVQLILKDIFAHAQQMDSGTI